jgi:hypothetical protein
VLSLACTPRAVKAPPWGLRIDISIGGQIWAMQGWPPEQTFDQILALDTVNLHVTGMPNQTDVQPWTNTTTLPPSLRVSADA